jgi:hypothetical protein
MSSPPLSRPRTSSRSPYAGSGSSDASVSVPGPAPAEAPEQLIGRYRYDRRSGAWWWSAEMFSVHGLPPGTVEPGTEVLLSHQHPDDRPRMLAALTGACSSARSFAVRIHVVRADGRQRDVLLVGEPVLEPDGAVAAVEGLCIDVTDCPAPAGPASSADRVAALETEVEQLHAAMASRAAIEQAKGILMLLTSCSDKVAFDLLAHISSHTHRKVRDVAQAITESAAGHTRLPDDVRAILRDACPPARPLH